MTGPVLVCGATGTTGGAVVRALVAGGTAVRALTRDPGSGPRLASAGAEPFVGDLTDPASLGAALDGADAVYVATPASPLLADLEGALARAAHAAGVRHLVKLSVLGAATDAPMRFSRAHHAAEQAIAGSGIGWTFLRPNGFMQNTLRWAARIPGGAIAEPVPDARWSIVDARDVAAVAAAVLTDPGAHAGRVYTLTGPEASSPREQVGLVGEVLGRPLTVEDVGIDDAVAGLRGSGVPAWTADGLGELLRFYADGLGETVSGDVRRVTGHPPGSFRRFVEDHRATFAA